MNATKFGMFRRELSAPRKIQTKTETLFSKQTCAQNRVDVSIFFLCLVTLPLCRQMSSEKPKMLLQISLPAPRGFISPFTECNGSVCGHKSREKILSLSNYAKLKSHYSVELFFFPRLYRCNYGNNQKQKKQQKQQQRQQQQ